MLERQSPGLNVSAGDDGDGITELGDAASLTTGGSGNSVEDKRYPYG